MWCFQDPLAGVVPRSLHELFEKIEAQVSASQNSFMPEVHPTLWVTTLECVGVLYPSVVPGAVQ